MLSGNEKKAPDFLYEKNLEFIWRLKYDTMRRLSRLFVTSLYSLKFYLFGYKIFIAAIVNKFAEDPELTKTLYFTPNHLDHSFSNFITFSDWVNFFFLFKKSIRDLNY